MPIGMPPKWAFAELHSYIAYKAALAGSMAINVDAHYTSQACPKCGYTSKETARTRGCCLSVTVATIPYTRTSWVRVISRCERCWPGKTGPARGSCQLPLMRRTMEAKAARRERYAELRWSPDTSP